MLIRVRPLTAEEKKPKKEEVKKGKKKSKELPKNAGLSTAPWDNKDDPDP